MVLKLNKAAYQKLIDEDIAAVRASNCEALEREHIVDVLRHSVEMYYPTRDPDTQVEKIAAFQWTGRTMDIIRSKWKAQAESG